LERTAPGIRINEFVFVAAAFLQILAAVSLGHAPYELLATYGFTRQA
jgi:hypothetical protein